MYQVIFTPQQLQNRSYLVRLSPLHCAPSISVGSTEDLTFQAPPSAHDRLSTDCLEAFVEQSQIHSISFGSCLATHICPMMVPFGLPITHKLVLWPSGDVEV